MAKKAPAKKKHQKLSDVYEISAGIAKRKINTCPKCGDGIFMAKHKDRVTCGKCGYTEFTKKE